MQLFHQPWLWTLLGGIVLLMLVSGPVSWLDLVFVGAVAAYLYSLRLENVQSDIVMMRTPDGHGRVELSKFITPKATRDGSEEPAVNTLGIRRIMFTVDDIDDVLDRLRSLGAELMGEVAQYEDVYRLCFVRGPEGIIVGLAEELDGA